MSRSSEGDAYDDSNIDEIDNKLQNISVDDRNVESNNVGEDNECYSGLEHEQSSTMSQANYYDEASLHLNGLNHLFHIDFMRSMQNLRTHEKRFLFCSIQVICLISFF